MFLSQFANTSLTYQAFVTNLHLLRVELRCKLQEKLHRVTGPLINNPTSTSKTLLGQSIYQHHFYYSSYYIQGLSKKSDPTLTAFL